MAASDTVLTHESREKAERTGLRIWCAEPPESDLLMLEAKLERSVERCDLILDGQMSAAHVAELADYLRTEAYTVKQVSEISETVPIITAEQKE